MNKKEHQDVQGSLIQKPLAALAIAALALAFGTGACAENATVGVTDPVALGIMQGYPVPADRQVTLDNWLNFPKNRWSFRNVQSLFPTASIERGETAPLPLKQGPALDVESLTFTGNDGATVTAQDYFKQAYVDGFIVLHKGQVVYERYFDSMTPGEPHLWQSMTKSVTGLLAEMLVAEGQLDLSRTAGSYVPEIAETVWGKATLRDLLNMQVAVEEPSVRIEHIPAAFWKNGNFLKMLQDPAARQAGENGKVWFYTNKAPQTIGLVMARVTGKSWSQLAQEKIWSKLGAEKDANIWLDVEGQAAAAGGMSTTLRDAARFAQMIGEGGRVAGRQVVPAKVIAALRQDAGNSAITSRGNLAKLKQRPEMAYKSYWFQGNDGKGSLECGGVYGQYIYTNPGEQITIVQFGSSEQIHPNPANWTGLMKAVVAKLSKA